MRTLGDRIRHALSFEAIGLLAAAPLGAWVFGFPLHEMGLVAAASAAIATAWNFVFNWLYDLARLRSVGTTEKTTLARVQHAVMFELGLLALLMPFIAWSLGVPLWQALVMDLSFALFYVVYAFGFNWAYDRVFPLPEWEIR